jgi:hypothetical protein
MSTDVGFPANIFSQGAITNDQRVSAPSIAQDRQRAWRPDIQIRTFLRIDQIVKEA